MIFKTNAATRGRKGNKSMANETKYILRRYADGVQTAELTHEQMLAKSAAWAKEGWLFSARIVEQEALPSGRALNRIAGHWN